MQLSPSCFRIATAVAIFCACTGCAMPTLVEVARRRQATAADRAEGRNLKDDVRIKYTVTDWDVLNFTDEVKRKLAARSSFHTNVRYGSTSLQATLGGLAGAASAIGWGVSAASGFGLGATYIFGLGQIFDAKSHAQAYEQSFTSVQAAEATYYFHQLGMGFKPGTGTGKPELLPIDKNGRSDIPSQTNLTPDGETLYYRVSKILKVLDDTLANKIPDLQDLKDAKGDTSATPVAPAVPPDQKTINSGGSSASKSHSAANAARTPAPTGPKSDTVASAAPAPTPTGPKGDAGAGAAPTPAPSGPKGDAVASAAPTPTPTGPKSDAVATSSAAPAPVPRSDDADVLRSYWAPGGLVNADHAKTLRQWLDAHEDGIHVAAFIDATEPKYALERARAREALLPEKTPQ